MSSEILAGFFVLRCCLRRPLQGDMEAVICRTGALLRHSCLGNFHLSENKSGPRNFFFYKRALAQTEPRYMDFLNVLQALGVRLIQYKGHPIEHLRQHKPKTSPDPAFLPLPNAESMPAFLSLLQALRDP